MNRSTSALAFMARCQVLAADCGRCSRGRVVGWSIVRALPKTVCIGDASADRFRFGNETSYLVEMHRLPRHAERVSRPARRMGGPGPLVRGAISTLVGTGLAVASFVSLPWTGPAAAVSATAPFHSIDAVGFAGTTLWAAGYADGHVSVAYANGAAWHSDMAPVMPDGSYTVTSLTTTASGSALVVGYQQVSSSSRNLLLTCGPAHCDRVSVPDPGSLDNGLNAVTASQDGHAWAVGSYTVTGRSPQPLILVQTSAGWRRMRGPNLRGASTWRTASATSASDLWLGGQTDGHAVAAHWDGSQWSTRIQAHVHGSSSSTLLGIVANDGGSVCAAGSTFGRSMRPFFECLSQGRWEMSDHGLDDPTFHVTAMTASLTGPSILVGYAETQTGFDIASSYVLTREGWMNTMMPGATHESEIASSATAPGTPSIAAGGFASDQHGGHPILDVWNGQRWDSWP